MRKLIGIGFLIYIVATLSGQSGKGGLPSDIQPDSLNRLPVVKREQMDENGKKAYDLNAGGPGKIAQPTGPGAIALYSPGASTNWIPPRSRKPWISSENKALWSWSS
jgi:hypothetical protein